MKRWKGFLFVLPSLLGVGLFYIVPFIASLVYCFTTGVSERKYVGFKNFTRVFRSETFQIAIRNVAIIMGIGVLLLWVASIIVTLLIERNLKKHKWLQAILFIPMVVPAASLMLLWKDLFTQTGILNDLFRLNLDWLNSRGAPMIMILLIVWKNLGYNIILIIGTLLTMPKEYEEAANLDGANFLTIAWYIKIPYLMPVLFFIFVISLSNSFKIFREIYLLQGDYPSEYLYLLQHFMNSRFAKLDYEALSAAAFILYCFIFCIIYTISYLQQCYMKNNV